MRRNLLRNQAFGDREVMSGSHHRRIAGDETGVRSGEKREEGAGGGIERTRFSRFSRFSGFSGVSGFSRFAPAEPPQLLNLKNLLNLLNPLNPLNLFRN